MKHYTPLTADALSEALTLLPDLTAPTRKNFLKLESRIGRWLSSTRAKLTDDPAEYKAFLRVFTNKRLDARQLSTFQCGRIYERCAKRCAGRDIIALCDTCEFSLTNLAGRTTARDAKQLGVLSDNKTAGLKLHCILCLERESMRPLGVAHAFVYASPKTVETSAQRRDTPFAQRQSARWIDSIHSALRHSVHTAQRVTFIADAEADQFNMLAGLFNTTSARDQTHDALSTQKCQATRPEVRWCFRLATDRIVRNPELGYWNKDQVTVSQYLNERCAEHNDHRVSVGLAASGSRKQRTVRLRIRSCRMSLRRPSGGGVCKGDKHYRGRAIPRCADVYVTIAEQLDRQGQGCGRMTSRQRERYHRAAANRGHSAPIHWALATNYEVGSEAEQLEALELYSKRWVIELFFRMLKSDGLDMERNASRRVDRWILVLLLGMDRALTAEKLVAMRDAEDRSGFEEFSAEQREVLEADDYARCHPRGDRAGKVYVSQNKQRKGSASWFAVQVAIMAGYMGNKKSPPGRKLMAEGLKLLEERVRALRFQKLYEQK